MSLKNKTTQQIISFLLIISILTPAVILLSIPKQVKAQIATHQVNDTAPVSWIQKVFQGLISGSTATTAVQTTASAGFDLKQWSAELVRQILRTFARRLLAQMTQSTVNWINSGFHGAPLFLERPESFFKDIAKSQIKDLVNTIGYNSSSFPFGKSFAINAIESYKSSFANNAQYSLSKVINDPVLLNNYRNDFSVGGWDGFMLNTQYPQNNYIGSQLMYANELARLLEGTGQSPASIVRDTLAQGQGFLSPQTCPTNDKYNNLKNQFQQPTFKCSLPPPIWAECPLDDNGYEIGNCSTNNAIARGVWQSECATQKAQWAVTNDCPGGLVNTTPGSVVGAQIMKAITGTYDQTSLAAAMGNSLSAIFDALLNKFMSSGLNALSNKINNADNSSDNFDYYGHTLGSPSGSGTSGGGLDWGGPDEIIVLSTFKINVQNAINNANQEFKLIDNNDANAPGLFQMFAKIWPKTQELDICLPGPNIGWQDRLDTEVEKASQELQGKMFDSDPEKVNAATVAYDGLKFAVDAFKSWINNKINIELPSGASYTYTVDSLKTVQEQALELTARKNAIMETLTKLESVKADLDTIVTEPARGSSEEQTLIRLKQRVDGMIVDLSSPTTVNEMQNKLHDAEDKLTNLSRLITKCQEERTAKGWANPGGEDSLFNNSKTEKELFCSLPIVGGYSHAPFINHGSITHSEIPLVNAENVYPDASGVSDNDRIDIALSCDVVSKSYPTDYKKNLPGSI